MLLSESGPGGVPGAGGGESPKPGRSIAMTSRSASSRSRTGFHSSQRSAIPWISRSGGPLPALWWCSRMAGPYSNASAKARPMSYRSGQLFVGRVGATVVQNGTRPSRRAMASTEQAMRTETGTLQELARRHLWMHFTRMSAYAEQDIPIIVRGEGCYVYDENGKRFLD